jgi:hypothetical protein
MTPTACSSKRKSNPMDHHNPEGSYWRSVGRMPRKTRARWNGSETSDQKKNMAKKAAKKKKPATRQGEIASVDNQGQVYWEIDRILDERVAANDNGTKEYLVRWKSSEAPDSWLPQGNLNASALTDRDALRDALVGMASILTNYVGDTITEDSIFSLASFKLYDLRDELAAYIPALQGKAEGDQQQQQQDDDENKQTTITKRLPPANKDELAKASECPSCQTTAFAADPVNDDQDEAPIQSRACSHSICRGCVGGLHMAALEQAPNSWRKWLQCPICKEPKAFLATDRNINYLACQILQACHTTTTTTISKVPPATNPAASVVPEDTKLPRRKAIFFGKPASFHGPALFFDVEGPAVESQKKDIIYFDVEGPAAAVTVSKTVDEEQEEEDCKMAPRPVVNLEEQALVGDRQADSESMRDESQDLKDEEETDTVVSMTDDHRQENVKLAPPPVPSPLPPQTVIDLEADTEEMDVEGFAMVDEQQDDAKQEEDNKKKRPRSARNLSLLLSNDDDDDDHPKAEESSSSLPSSSNHQDTIIPPCCFSTGVKRRHRLDHPRQEVEVIDLCDDDDDDNDSD